MIDEQTAADLEFIQDFSTTFQCKRCVEHNIIYLKHRLIPATIKVNQSEIPSVDLNISSFLSSWIWEDSHKRILAFKVICSQIDEALKKSGYTLTPINTISNVKITW